jgi:replicative DNA helicase
MMKNQSSRKGPGEAQDATSAERTDVFPGAVSLTTIFQQCSRRIENPPADASAGRFQPAWPSLDCHFAALKPGDVAIVGATRNQGKTWFCLDLAMRASRCGPVLWRSRLLRPEELAFRILTLTTGIETGRLTRGWIVEQERKAIRDAITNLSNCRLHLGNWWDEGPEQGVGGSSVLLGPEKPVLAFIDDLGIECASFPWNASTLTWHVETWRKVAQFAQVPLVLIAGLPLPPTHKRGKQHPDLSDLVEAGFRPELAELVIFLDRPEYWMGADTPPFKKGMMEVLVVKSPLHLGMRHFKCGFDGNSGQILKDDGRI